MMGDGMDQGDNLVATSVLQVGGDGGGSKPDQ